MLKYVNIFIYMRSKIFMKLKIGIILHNGSITQRIYET